MPMKEISYTETAVTITFVQVTVGSPVVSFRIAGGQINHELVRRLAQVTQNVLVTTSGINTCAAEVIYEVTLDHELTAELRELDPVTNLIEHCFKGCRVLGLEHL